MKNPLPLGYLSQQTQVLQSVGATASALQKARLAAFSGKFINISS
ncbi:hypothetical protein [Pseudomonas savastanoi]|nr:hypothetical protein [Pseudomonas savastanoi]